MVDEMAYQLVLTVTLRLTQRTPGPDGLTLLTVPSDRDILDEAHRLRSSADLTKPPPGDNQ